MSPFYAEKDGSWTKITERTSVHDRDGNTVAIATPIERDPDNKILIARTDPSIDPRIAESERGTVVNCSGIFERETLSFTRNGEPVVTIIYSKKPISEPSE